jgi:DNA invertase Pin-like site-specific DNA recombinase
MKFRAALGKTNILTLRPLSRTGIAEFERNLIRERTGAGGVIAKANGARFGRPRRVFLTTTATIWALTLEAARRLASRSRTVSSEASTCRAGRRSSSLR